MERYPSTLAAAALYAAAMLAGYQSRSASDAAEGAPTKVAATASSRGPVSAASTNLSTWISAGTSTGAVQAAAAPRPRALIADVSELFRPTSLAGGTAETRAFTRRRSAAL